MSRSDKDSFGKHQRQPIASDKPVLINTRPGKYLTIHGKGPPEESEFSRKTTILYNMVFAMRDEFEDRKKEFSLGKLETIWSLARESFEYQENLKADWRWQQMIRIPDRVEEMERIQILERQLEKGGSLDLTEVRLETIQEGPCIQMLHKGPYAGYGKTLGKIREFAGSRDLEFHGYCHEIYFSDPRRVDQHRFQMTLRKQVQ